METLEILEFIKSCVFRKRIYWTHHSALRMKERGLGRHEILSSVDSYELIEDYPQERYLPSYLVFSDHEGTVIHLVVAADFDHDSIVLITAYEPSAEEWSDDLKKRRQK